MDVGVNHRHVGHALPSFLPVPRLADRESLADRPTSHPSGEQDGGAVSADIRLALPRDFVGCAVRGGRQWERQAGEVDHPFEEAHKLHRDLILIVLHREHGVEFTRPCSHINCVGRVGSGTVESLRPRRLDGGTDHVDLFATKVPFVARVRVEAGDRDPSRLALLLVCGILFDPPTDPLLPAVVPCAFFQSPVFIP